MSLRPRRSVDRLSPTPASDPRSRSTQSLVPEAAPDEDPRRLLLLVYIHGFYGNAQSFRSFPAHVHALVRHVLADSHVVHTKIYPRYKTYHAVDVARDNLSAWLEPHESPDTDVVLVGHSMGGLLAAEVALMPGLGPGPYNHGADAFKHRILGTLSLDAPFLGLHPRIIAAGISSLFQPAEDAADGPALLAAEPPPAPPETDPCFDPPYWNDEPFREQPFLKRVMHFTSKHKSEGFFNALRNHIVSHLEFGGCLADYPGLVSRYDRLRALEDVDEVRAGSDGSAVALSVRVRFANYYTLCSGRPKVPKRTDVGAERHNSEAGLSNVSADDEELRAGNTECSTKESVETPVDTDSRQQQQQQQQHKAKKDEQSEGEDDAIEEQPDCKRPAGQEAGSAALVLTTPPSSPPPSAQSQGSDPAVSRDEDDGDEGEADDTDRVAIPDQEDADLEPIPDEPTKPEPPDFEQFAQGPARKQAEKEAKRAQRAYEEAVKNRAKVIRRRDKLLERRRKEAKREADKQQREAQKAARRREKETERRQRDEAKAKAAESEAADRGASTPRGCRKFCALPRKVTAGGGDPTWVDVYLEGVDEVGAHCGLFVPTAAHYDALVGDVGSRIAGWVLDSLSTRAVLDDLT
ncbi:hypothetical protein XA68_17678 [Ophiocordyceps unilateralis]|uniref:AB hydrolase-1 domain-containing protein n=1 Tax=Ophiocordyceps unilateralis TaxID=268505 RepID=A0A2A9PKB2_OPHUN|nr:hypothetical protein XA68_17678 [Ophiocordyceps unilateralis]